MLPRYSRNSNSYSLALFVVSISALNPYHKLLFYTPCPCSDVAMSRPHAVWGCCDPRNKLSLHASAGCQMWGRNGLEGEVLGQVMTGWRGAQPPPVCRSCSKMLAFEIPRKGKVSHGTADGLLLTDSAACCGQACSKSCPA